MNNSVIISPDFAFSYDKTHPVFESDGNSIILSAGNIYGIYGYNGVGKTTFLNVLNTILYPTVGSISYKLDDTEFTFDRASRLLPSCLISNNIRRSFQTPLLIDEWTVRENIVMAKRQYSLEHSLKQGNTLIDDIRIRELLDFVQITNNTIVGKLSYGQRRIIANLQMLYCKAHLTILDEPFANLNETISKVLRDEYKSLAKSLGLIIVSVEHNKSVLDEFADRVVSLTDRKLTLK